VQSHASADASRAYQLVDEIGALRLQLGELVHHQHQVRQRVERGIMPPADEIRVQVVAAGGRQQRLAALDLGLQGHQCPAGEIAVQVGDEAHQVGKVAQRARGAAALVVDQHQGHLVRVEASGQPEQQRLQQGALARARRTGDQAVRAVGGLMQVQL
jgi:hypothetical protein